MSSRLDPYELVGSTFQERYAVGAFVGFGRFSALYRGTEADSLRPVAIRLLNVRSALPPSQRPVVLQRLRAFFPSGRDLPSVQDVTKACSALAGVLDVGAAVTAEGRWIPGVVQSSAAGETLQSVLAQERGQDPSLRTLARAIESLTPVADALTYAHASGHVHGGVAPQSIMMRRQTAVHVLDLGMSGALGALQARDRAFVPPAVVPPLFFDPAYASPEHFSAARAPDRPPLTPASDVFSLALVILELLTGRAALGEGDDVRLEAASVDPAVRPTPRVRGRDLGGYVEAVFERALAVRAADRHGTVESFWSALRAASRLTLRPSRPVIPPPLPTSSPPPLPASSTPPLPASSTTTPTLAEAFVARAPRPSTPAAFPPAGDFRCAWDATLPSSGTPDIPAAKPRPSGTPASKARPESPLAAARPRMTSQDDGADDLVLGEIIAGKYSIERLLGRGGMGTVWLCTHLGLGERVAVKVMSRKMADNDEVRARFEREARAAAKIKSRYVARVYDTGALADGRPYIVMEYMEGETLADAMKGNQALPLVDTVRILGQVGRGLARAHELGIVHRDIKPENVFLAHTADDGVLAKVFDFGIVKVSDAMNDGSTREGVVIGTPHYMSPEQADGLAIDARSDIFSLGVMSFRMLTGKRLFNGDSILQILMRICSAPLPSLADHAPSIPPAVDAWFQRACARKREDRFSGAIECVEALARAAGVDVSRDVSLLPPPPSTQTGAPIPLTRALTGSEARNGQVLSALAPEALLDAASGTHELLSCPTLLDEEHDADDAVFELCDTTNVGVARNTNPLFDIVERSVPPAALEAAARRRSGGGARRLGRFLALGGFLVLGGVGVVVFREKLALTVSVEETTGAQAPAARAPALTAPRAEPAVAAPASGPTEAPASDSLVTGSGTPDGGLATPSHGGQPPPPPRNGRTRRAASAPAR